MRFKVQGFECLWFRVQVVGLRFESLGFVIWGLEFEFKSQGLSVRQRCWTSAFSWQV